MANGKSGRPPKFESPKILGEQIEEYFSLCTNEKKIATITGLACFLGTTRKTLLDYECCDSSNMLKGFDDNVKADYIRIIKNAKARIEAGYEQLLFDKNTVVGAIFTLKNNFGWVDKQNIEQTNRTIEVTLIE